MKKELAILDFSKPKIKQMVIAHIQQIKGLYWFELRRCRNQRSLQQNAYYFGVVLKSVQAGMEEAWGERYSIMQVHQYMKKKFLTEPVVNRNTGEIVDETVGSSSDLDVSEFADYLDNIIKFAAEWLNTEVPSPNEYHKGAA